MNPNYMEHKFPQIKPHPFNKVRTTVLSFATAPPIPNADLIRHRFSARQIRMLLT